MKRRVNVLIVDDHPLFRKGMKSLLQELDADVNVQEASSVANAQSMAEQPFDLVLVDLQMPGSVGMDALIQMKATFENSAVVVVSADESSGAILSAIDTGAAGYVPKTTDTGITTNALRRLLAHGLYLPPSALTLLPTGLDQNQPKPGTPNAEPADAPRVPASKPSREQPTAWPREFSARQKAALRSLLQGKPNKLIARDIGAAEGTVKAHLWAVYQLLGVKNRTQAMLRAHQLGLFDLLDADAETDCPPPESH